ncbi:unnamed protein product [Lactuca virosa]|uniref:Methyltransferase n=1 Tax=Lactuca virosa TaxID=75947 RepID=A0AAU9NWN3_9ASTR|nr:unnamed protein product [Lactuca virosa]
MGDDETVVSQTSAVDDYSSPSYSASDYDNITFDITGKSEATDVGQQVPSTASQDVSENGVGSYSVHTSASTQQLVDISGISSWLLHSLLFLILGLTFEINATLSPEEDRLWNMVKAYSLDFNAWTALIEETEKTSEANVLKIRKVYDAFLAEFPLCYGYWKKFGADAMEIVALWTKGLCVEISQRQLQNQHNDIDDDSVSEFVSQDLAGWSVVDVGTTNGLLLQELAKQGYIIITIHNSSL